ncbi:MAG: hypothetical protein Q8L73_09820 [Methylotenera sp.]|nr:hypothetical protein [Methylotenera sp.]
MDLSSTNWTKAQGIKVNECLAKILSSPMFAKAERQQRFLSYIMAETLEGRAEKLKGYTIGVEVFDRESSFDPAIDAIVRVEAARLRSKLREYYDGEGCADPVRFELPKGNYAVHIEWREVASTQDHSTNATSHPQLIKDKPSLAILPFVNMSSDPEQEYFADGITDSLIMEVSRLSGLFVISRQSSFIYKSKVKRAEEIGLELGVGHLLEGSVQRSGEWVRISAKLIDTVSGVHVWAERYDRELKDIFALQDDVTRRIAAVLQVKLASDEAERFSHEGTLNLKGHDTLLRGLERFWGYSRESVEAARVHFEDAVQFAPSYAAAHAWLARSLAFQWIFLWDPRDETLERAFEHARAAVDLDPQHPLAYSVLGWVQAWRRQGEAAIAAGRRAVALDPNNADAYLFLAMTLVMSNRGAEALRYIETGMRLNPHPSAFYQFVLGLSHFVLEDYDEAIAAFRRGIEVTDVFISNHVWLCVAYTLLDHEDEARIQREKVLALTNGRKPPIQSVWLDEAWHSKSDGLMQRAGLT